MKREVNINNEIVGHRTKQIDVSNYHGITLNKNKTQEKENEKTQQLSR